MSYDEFIFELNKAGLTIRRFADLMGMKPNSISNNKKKGEVPIHLAIIATLLAEMSGRKIAFEAIFDRLHLNQKRPRGANKAGKFSGDPHQILEIDT